MRIWSLILALSIWGQLGGAEESTARKTPLVKAIERAELAVVNIHTIKTNYDREAAYSSTPRKVNGMGSGIVIDERGYIVTNQHVINDVDTIRVTLFDKATYPGQVISFDRKHDLAIIKVQAPRALPVMPMGTSSDLMRGETVVAVGNPFGYEHSVTSGIISALGRNVEARENTGYKNLIQTDTPINPGNSGGPLINMDGEVIGINVAIRQGAQQIGFAIPIDDARITISRLLNSKRLGATYHGLALEDIKNGVQRELQVAGVESGSPADQSGFRDGDVILQAGSLHTIDQADWERALLGRKPGEKLAVIVRRSGSDTALTLELSRASGAPAKNPTQVVSQESPVEKEESSEDLAWSRIGLTLEQAPVSKLAGQTTYSKGLLISAVRSGSPADRARLEKGDVLVVLQAWRTENLQNLNWVLNHADFATFLPLKCHILRGGKAQYLQLDMNSNVNQMSFKAEQSIATEAWKKLGLKVTVAKPKDLKGQIKYKAGLKVEKVRDKGPASQVHVRPGDIVVVLEDWRMESMSNLGYFLDTDSKEPILIRIVRDGVELYDYLETK